MKRTRLVLLACLGTPMIHASVITPTSVTSTIAGDAGSDANWLLSDNPGQGAAGLQDSTGAAVTLATGDSISKAAATYAYRAPTGHEESWTRDTPFGNPVFVFDLSGGGDIDVGSAILWQYGNDGGDGPNNGGNGTRDFRVIFHTEAEGNTFDFTTETADISGTMDVITGDNTINNVAQLFFAGTSHSARYAAIRIDTNYGGVNGYTGGDRYGLGEVRFATEAVHDPVLYLPATVSGETSGAPITLNIPITNDGTANALNLTAAELSGVDASFYTITSTLPLSIAPGATANLTVDFNSGGSIGTFTASVDVTSDDVLRPQTSVALSVNVATPEISVPATNNYGPVANGAALQTFTVPVSNSGTGDLTLYDAFFVQGATTTGLFEDFAVVHDFVNDGALTVSPAGQLNLQFTFDPTGLKGGIYPATLLLASDDSDEAGLKVSLMVEVTNVAGSTLVAWWPLESNSRDASGNGHHGVDAGTVSYAASGANAATGGAAQFDGSNRIDVPFDEALNPSSFTLTLWANPSLGGDYHSAVTNRVDANPTAYGYVLYNSPSATWQYWSGDGTPVDNVWDVTQASPADDVALNTWTHLALSYDHLTQTKTLYVNGAAVATSPGVPLARNLLRDLHLAGGGDQGTEFMFEGMLDDVAIFREALDSTEINTIRTAGVTGFTGLPQPSDAAFAITSVTIAGGNVVIGSASGMATGQTYHLQSSTTLDLFTPLPGSTFTGGDPIPVVPVSGPRLFIRIAEGAAP